MCSRLVIDCCQIIRTASGLVCESGQEARQARVKGVDTILGPECASSRRGDDLVHRSCLHSKGQISAVGATTVEI